MKQSKSNGSWAAKVQQRKEQRAANRDRGTDIVGDLNVTIKALEKERGEITKTSLGDYVSAKISQGEYMKRVALVDKLGEELKPLIHARDEVIREKNEIAEKADGEMLAAVVTDINALTHKQASVLKQLVELLPGLHEKAFTLWELQNCRHELYTMARSITKSRVNLGLDRDLELEKVLAIGDFGTRYLSVFMKPIFHNASKPEGGLCGVSIPARLETGPPPARKKRKSGKAGKAESTVFTLEDKGRENAQVLHPRP